MNLLLTCSTLPEFSPEALDLWNKFCIADWMPGSEIVSYLMFAPASSSACIDAIVFLRPDLSMGLVYGPDGSPSLSTGIRPWEAHWLNAEIARRIRDLPETCAMRDGRKWKRIPQVFLTDSGSRHSAYEGLDVELVLDVTERMLHDGYASPVTWSQIDRSVNRYQQKAMAEYARVGFLVTADHGLYRVKRALLKKSSDESEFYYGRVARVPGCGFIH
jgi:hypothetical protein